MYTGIVGNQNVNSVEDEILQLRSEAYGIHPKIILDCHIFATRSRIDLLLLLLPKDLRCQGYGSLIMSKLVTIADTYQHSIMLSPENCFGTPLHVLEKFYQKYGFEWVTPHEMVRVPQKPNEVLTEELLDTIYAFKSETLPS